MMRSPLVSLDRSPSFLEGTVPFSSAAQLSVAGARRLPGGFASRPRDRFGLSEEGFSNRRVSLRGACHATGAEHLREESEGSHLGRSNKRRLRGSRDISRPGTDSLGGLAEAVV